MRLLLFGLLAAQAVLGLGEDKCIFFPPTQHSSLLDTLTLAGKSTWSTLLGKRSQSDFASPFIISSNDRHHQVSTPILVDSKDDEAIHIAAHFFARDIERVTGLKPQVHNDTLPTGTSRAILVGSVGSELLRGQEPSWTSEMEGRWEVWDARVVRGEHVHGDLNEALVLSGSDRVGTSLPPLPPPSFILLISSLVCMTICC